jgi:hypothetical protein
MPLIRELVGKHYIQYDPDDLLETFSILHIFNSTEEAKSWIRFFNTTLANEKDGPEQFAELLKKHII